MTYEINYNREDCLGCGACTVSDNWEMDNEGKAKPKKTSLEEIGSNQDAADVCPAEIIKIIEK